MISDHVLDLLETLAQHPKYNTPIAISRFLFLWSIAMTDSYQISRWGNSKSYDPFFLPSTKMKNLSDKYRNQWMICSSAWLTAYMRREVLGDLSVTVPSRKVLFGKYYEQYILWTRRTTKYLEDRKKDFVFPSSFEAKIEKNNKCLDVSDEKIWKEENQVPLRFGNSEKVVPSLHSESLSHIVDSTAAFFPSEEIWQKELSLLSSFSATDKEKILCHFWSGGKNSVTPPGMWAIITYMILKGNGMSVDEEVRTWLHVSTALFHAAIVAWKIKYRHMQARPSQRIKCWSSYLPNPPFPDFVSGHSTFSSAACEVLLSLHGEAKTNLAALPCHFSNRLLNLFCPLLFPSRIGTFSPRSIHLPSREIGNENLCSTSLVLGRIADLADSAGKSRIDGGIHIESSNIGGKYAGNRIAELTFATCNFSICN